MKLAIFGSTGDVGSRLAEEATRRGHSVTGIVRNERKRGLLPEGVIGRVLNVHDADGVAAVIAENDRVISALRPPEGEEASLPELTQSILDGARQAKKPACIVGGAANLFLPDNSGHTVLTAPDFLPENVKSIARACFSQFLLCRANEDVDWVYFSPPALLQPGERLKRYRRGSDILLVDDAGNSQISMEDFAFAILDEIENPRDNARRVTFAY